MRAVGSHFLACAAARVLGPIALLGLAACPSTFAGRHDCEVLGEDCVGGGAYARCTGEFVLEDGTSFGPNKQLAVQACYCAPTKLECGGAVYFVCTRPDSEATYLVDDRPFTSEAEAQLACGGLFDCVPDLELGCDEPPLLCQGDQGRRWVFDDGAIESSAAAALNRCACGDSAAAVRCAGTVLACEERGVEGCEGPGDLEFGCAVDPDAEGDTDTDGAGACRGQVTVPCHTRLPSDCVAEHGCEVRCGS